MQAYFLGGASMDGKDMSKSKGGVARAKVLSPEERKSIARKAALARWNADIPKAEFEGDLDVAGSTITSAVLPDETRVLSQATFLRALGRSRSPKAGTGVLSTVDDLPFFLQANQLKDFIDDDLRKSTAPIFYMTKTGKRAVGYDATLLPKVCEVYLRFRDQSLINNDGKLPKQYAHIIEACDILMRGLAHVGIIALVDEATGYQQIRDRKALQKILEKYCTDEWSKWTKTFPDEFYRELFRLKGVPYPPYKGSKKPSYVGHWTNDVIYSRLAPGVLKALKEKTPRLPSGSRKRKFFQHLSKDYGHPELRDLLSNTMFLMKGCTDWDDFHQRLDTIKPKYGDTIQMKF
jgi:hypothetical protein